MSIPIIALFYLYLLFVLVWLIFSIIAFYHIMAFGQVGFISLAVTLSYFAVSMFVLYMSYQYLSQVNWDVSLNILRGGVDIYGPQ